MAAKKRVDTKNAELVKRQDYADTLHTIVAGGFCPFCEEHLFKHHTKPLIRKGRHWLVTDNAWPYAGTRAHVLFITRKHIEAAEQLSPAAWTELLELYRELVTARKLRGATLMVRSGDTAYTGASVNHLHAHVVSGSPRTKSSKMIRALVSFKK